MSITLQIKEKARQLGFFKIGIARIEPFPQLNILEGWIKNRKHGEMLWMERTREKRQNPSLVLPNVRSIVVAGLNYYISERVENFHGFKISRYAWGVDYHLLMEEKLRQLTDYILCLLPSAKAKYYVDTGPVMEKPWAQKAGLGWIGKNTNLISPDHGSYLFLGEVLLDVELDYDYPGVDLCGNCSLCIQACPTDALTPYALDSTKCVSYLTIEKKGDIPPDVQKGIGEWIYGCDDCQEVCPWNASPRVTEEPCFHDFNPALETLSLESLREADFNDSFKKSPIKRIKYQGLLRNLQIAQENQALT
ncbi:MAG: tRNA epoxyqueuosine(34) reductase QueG [Nitrospiria bacterium]